MFFFLVSCCQNDRHLFQQSCQRLLLQFSPLAAALEREHLQAAVSRVRPVRRALHPPQRYLQVECVQGPVECNLLSGEIGFKIFAIQKKKKKKNGWIMDAELLVFYFLLCLFCIFSKSDVKSMKSNKVL